MRSNILRVCCVIAGAAALAFGSAQSSNNQGIQALQAERYEEAIQLFTMAQHEAPDNRVIRENLLAAYNNAALALEKKGNFAAARRYMKQACAIDPQNSRIRNNYAALLVSQSFKLYHDKDSRSAIPLLEESLKYDDASVEAHALLAQTYYDADDYAQARRQWEKVLMLEPGRPGVREALDKLAAEVAAGGNLQDVSKLHFKVRYEGNGLWTASQRILNILEDAWNNAGWKLGVFPREPLTVIVYGQQEFNMVTGKPDWFAGIYDGKIRLRQVDVEGNEDRLRQIVYHEYMHAYVHYIAGVNVPVWLHEGIAQCYENMPARPVLRPAEKRLLEERLMRGMPTPDEVDGMIGSTTSQADVHFGYIYAKAFTDYLIRKGFDVTMRQLLEQLGRGDSLNDACARTFSRSLEQMSLDWQEEVRYDTSF